MKTCMNYDCALYNLYVSIISSLKQLNESVFLFRTQTGDCQPIILT